MRGIMAAIAGGMDADTAVMGETLLYAVQRSIQCARTRRVLDVRDAILYTLAKDGKTLAGECVTSEWWSENASVVQAACDARGLDLEVIDGRILAGKRVGPASDMSEDSAMTAIVGASNDYGARVVCASLPAPTLRALLDLLHVSDAPTGRARQIDRIVKDAR